jgi:hypothetical protein
MNPESHATRVEARREEIYRAMLPAQRLRQSLRLHALMRSLMDAGLRAQHPDWSDEQRRRVIAERVLNARTG